MQRIERQRRRNSDKAELSRLLPAAGVERLTDDATKRKALDLLPRRISGALMKQGKAWMLQPRILLDDAKESNLNKQERDREQQQMQLRRGY
jgi:glycerol-3-phosphate dehydrogenase